MKIKLPFGHSKRVVGEASIGIKASSKEVFSFIAENFFLNYPKWTPDIVALEYLEEGNSIFVGAKGRQVREDNGALVESLFEIVEYTPYSSFILQGSNIPYRNTYLTAREDDQTRLTFRFELLDIELFMRPFEKLIRIAIEEGAENAVEKIKELVTIQCLQRAS
ncbi:MAG: SRPBCC family protein [Methylococcales bacterium]|nr:SRPBCC family protein [Methylococcales bacterium]